MLVFFESVVIAKIIRFLSGQGLWEKPSLEKRGEFSKFLLAFLFAGVFFYLLFVNYPFPKTDSGILEMISFFVFSWVVSGGLPFVFKTEGKIFTSRRNDLPFILFGALFFGIGLSFPQFFYFHGLVGLGFAVMGITGILLRT